MAFFTTRSLLRTTLVMYTQRAGIKRNAHRVIRTLYERRQKLGPEAPQPRSQHSDWNYSAELYAFGKRLNEDFQQGTLRTIFTHKSYLDAEERKRREMDLPPLDVPLDLRDNASLVDEGETLMRSYITDYLSYVLPLLPQEGVEQVTNYLMSEEVLLHVASNLGMGDLVLCEEFPPNNTTLTQSLKAAVGGLAHDQSTERVDLFIQDFILAQLIGKDINDIWEIKNPMGVLIKLLEKQGRGLPEPRLLRESGRDTILAVYVVGIYSDKKLIGSGPGETLVIAEEMAARDALKRLFQTTDKMPEMPFGLSGRKINVRKNLDNVNNQSVSN